MKIKRFQGKTLRAALSKVRAELGEDAVILSTQTVAEGVEVVAAMDESADEPRAPQPITPQVQQPAPQLEEMVQELAQMRQLLEQQLAGLTWGQTTRQTPETARLLKKMLSLGLGWELAQSLLDSYAQLIAQQGEQAWSGILNALSEGISVVQHDLLRQGGIVALVGPTGVGKTTTIAKLVGRFVMRHGAGQVALITTDCYKIGAQAQLQTFGDLLGVPIYVAQSREELETLLISLKDRKLILIDTAGMSQKDLRITQQLTAGYSGLVPIKNYLVLSAATPLSVMREVYQAFSQMRLHGLILTKLDEAVQLGAALTLLYETKLPLAYLSEGQRVPEDIQAVNKDALLDQAIVLGQQGSDERAEKALRLGVGEEFFNAQ